MLKIISKKTFNLLKEEIENLKKENEELNSKQFREGDCVYVLDGEHNPLQKYYLLKKYWALGGECCIISENNKEPIKEDSTKHLYLYNTTFTKYLSHKRPEQCPHCNNIL